MIKSLGKVNLKNLSGYDKLLIEIKGGLSLCSMLFEVNVITGDISSAISESDIVKINEVIASLSENEAMVIRMRFGLNNADKVATFNEIGNKLNVTGNRVRQIYGKALNRLRHPRRQQLLPKISKIEIEKDLIEKSAVTNQKAIETSLLLKNISIAQDALNLCASHLGPTSLDTSIYDLELSIRTRNCLIGARLETVRDVITKTPRELLILRSFGRKSLRELEKALAQKNLTLGMNL